MQFCGRKKGPLDLPKELKLDVPKLGERGKGGPEFLSGYQKSKSMTILTEEKKEKDDIPG